MKKTKLLFLFNLLLILLTTYSCQVEDLSRTPTERTSVQGKKINPEFLTHQLSNKKIKPVWQSAITFENIDAVEVNFTLNNKYYKPLSENGKIVGRQRLLLTLDKQGLVKETIIEYRPSNNFAGDIKDINSSNFKEKEFEGQISFKNPVSDFAIVWIINKNTIVQKLTETKKKNTNKSSGYESCQWNNVTYWLCVGSGIEESCFFTNEDLYQCEWVEYEPTNPEIPPTTDPYDCSLGNWPWCDGTDDPGSDSGYIVDETPPSCESFNFTSKKGANWQEAAVKNITLKIVVLTENRAEITNTMIFPQAVLFGMPINFNKGNGDVTPGAAATVSAMVLDVTMKEMTRLYAQTLTNELTLRTRFQELLINNYRIYTNGGTVNFNSTSSLPPTNYKTNPQQTGICDN